MLLSNSKKTFTTLPPTNLNFRNNIADNSLHTAFINKYRHKCHTIFQNITTYEKQFCNIADHRKSSRNQIYTLYWKSSFGDGTSNRKTWRPSYRSNSNIVNVLGCLATPTNQPSLVCGLSFCFLLKSKCALSKRSVRWLVLDFLGMTHFSDRSYVLFVIITR